MSTDKFISVPKIVWCSPDTKGDKNEYIRRLTKEGYQPEQSITPDSILNFLQTNSESTYIVIISGQNDNQSFTNMDSFENVAALVLFEDNKEPVPNSTGNRVSRFFTRFAEVVDEVKTVTQRYLLKAALDCTKHSEFKVAKSMLEGKKESLEQPSGQFAYYHFETGRVLDFKLLSLLSTEHSTPEDIKKELCAFLPKTEDGEKGVKKIEERFEGNTVNSFNIMKEFCFIYSTPLIYKEFNRACASRSYHKIIKTLTMLLKELQIQPDSVFRSDQPVYRGIPKDCMKAEDYEKNRNGFWPSFTSTSLNVKIAEEYAGEGGFIFVITLSKSNVHPNVILKNDWSSVPREEEVLLLPYFSVKTTNVTQKDGYTYIYLEQNEKDSVLSLQDMTIWTQRIEEELLKSMNTEIDRISKDFCSSINMAKILINENSKSLFRSHIKKICDQVLCEQKAASSWKAKLNTINNSKEIQTKIAEKFKQEIPEIMSKLMKKLACSLHQQAKKSISDIIKEELLLRPDIYQNALKSIETSLNKITLPWSNAVREITSKGILMPFLRTFLSALSSSYRSSWENELEEKIFGALWQGFCKSVEASREDLSDCSHELGKNYKMFFSDTKMKLQKLVANMMRDVKV